MPRSILIKISAGVGFAGVMAASTIHSISVQAAEPTIAPSPAPAKVEPAKPPVVPRKIDSPKPVITPSPAAKPAQPPTAPAQVVAPAQPTAPTAGKTDPIVQQLLGQWKTKQPINGDTLSLIFAPDGKCFLMFSSGTGKTAATEIQYKVDSAPKPMHIDFVLPEGSGIVQTLFELAGKDMRVQLMQTSPGKPRPTAFQEPTVMQKVSDATTLPPGVELSNPKRQSSQPAPQSEGKVYVGSINRTQQAYFLENSKFASKIEELGTGIKPETDSYRYQIVPQEDGKQVMSIGLPKKEGLRSYTGAVFITQTAAGEATSIAGICESIQPSMKAPAMPKLTSAKPNQMPQIVCPAGSQSLSK